MGYQRKVLSWSIPSVCFHSAARSLFWSWDTGMTFPGLSFRLVGTCSLAGGHRGAWASPSVRAPALLLLSRKIQISTHCVTLHHVRPISVSVFLPCKPSSSFVDGRQKGAQQGLCSRMGIRWWCLRGHVNPRHGDRKSLVSLCFRNSRNTSAALYLGKGLQPEQPAPGPCGTVICVLVLFPQLVFR